MIWNFIRIAAISCATLYEALSGLSYLKRAELGLNSICQRFKHTIPLKAIPNIAFIMMIMVKTAALWILFRIILSMPE